MDSNPKYFAYRTKVFAAGSGIKQAKLISKMPQVKDPMQDEPYGADLKLKYQINPRFKPPDNYVGTHSFTLYSQRLIKLLEKYGVKFEKFPAEMVDKDNKELKNLKYFVFHFLEGVQDGIDQKASEYNENTQPRIKELVLDFKKFEHRSIILLDKVYIPIMREDLKEEIVKDKITGFEFLSVDKYVLNQFGLPPDYKD